MRFTSWFLLVLAALSLDEAKAQRNYSYRELKPCPMSSPALGEIEPQQDMEPCIIFEVFPTFLEEELKDQVMQPKEAIDGSYNGTFVLSVVQVTPHYCFNQRDGAPTGVQFLNRDNDGRGVAIGFGSNTVTDGEKDREQQIRFVQFHFVSVVAGNPHALTEEEYNRRHVQILESMISTLNAAYIVGTCSFASAVEKQVALDHKVILMAQVGPPGYYTDKNPYVFGMHINSDLYPLPNVQSLNFLSDQQRDSGGPSKIPVRIIYRTKSEFFYSTCRSAIDSLKAAGFTDIQELAFDHAADDDGDGVSNQFDEDFLRHLADQACPPQADEHREEASYGHHPALFVCSLTEHDIIVRRWLETGCRPLSAWVTASTWGWAIDNPNLVPYFQGGGQWHPAFTYDDVYFESGSAMLSYNARLYGYSGNYDQVVSYAIPVLFAQHLISAYRVVDNPDPVSDFDSPDGREALRRDLMILKADTLFGPVAFDENQRNNGREAAGSQWLPINLGDDANDEGEVEQQIQNVKSVSTPTPVYADRLVAPYLQAEAATVIVAESAKSCKAGYFINSTKRYEVGSILKSGCDHCPVDTFQPDAAKSFQCNACPYGSTTSGLEGQEACYRIDNNLLSPAILAVGYFSVALTWLLSIGFMVWIRINRNDAVVKVSQVEFLNLICIGGMISSSTIIAVSFQAGSNENTKQASIGCTVAPFLYAIGWTLQYSSLSAKSYRLFLIMRNNQHLKRVKVTFLEMLRIVVAVIAIDLAIIIAWTVVSPLVYKRSAESINTNDASGVITVESSGSCVMKNDSISFWAFAGPIMGIHFLLLIGTNYLLYRVRNVADRYQEQKFIAMASVLMFEILLVGIPVTVAVKDSPVATHIILVGIIAVSDIGILCFTFVPKIMYQRSGLDEGVGFGESILKHSLQKASLRESERRGRTNYDQMNMSSHSERKCAVHDCGEPMPQESTNHCIDEAVAGPRIMSVPGRNTLCKSIVEELPTDLQQEASIEEFEVENDENDSSDLIGSTDQVYNIIVQNQDSTDVSSVHKRKMQFTANLMTEQSASISKSPKTSAISHVIQKTNCGDEKDNDERIGKPEPTSTRERSEFKEVMENSTKPDANTITLSMKETVTTLQKGEVISTSSQSNITEALPTGSI